MFKKFVFSFLLQFSSLVFADVNVLVTPVDGGFQIKAEFVAPVTKDIAYGVLTDFDNMAKFLPNISESKVIESKDGVILNVRQKGVAKAGWFSVPFESTRTIELSPKKYAVVTVSNDNGKMNSKSQVSGDDGNVRVVYDATWYPESKLAQNFGASSTQKQVESQFQSMLKEMIARK
jgi:hypothetical protein